MDLMEKIHYAGETLITGTAIAQALLTYASALASASDSDTVYIPVYDENGQVRNAEFLVGPASQLVAVEIDSEFEELVDDEVVRSLDLAARRFEAPRPFPTAATEVERFPDFDDFS